MNAIDRTGRLREVYWARRAEEKSGRKPFVNAKLYWRPDRTEIGRRGDEPGDGFIYVVSILPELEDRFEWIEVTEVFTTVPAPQVQGAMRAWNGISDRHPVDLGEFLESLPRGRPSRVEQRNAADWVIAQVERKLAKASYRELLEKYGYGTLVVGMPLWFAPPPDDPFRAENAVDDFMTRTGLGLLDIKRRMLDRGNCPFRSVVVVWDTTPEAMGEWREGRSAMFEDAANASLENPMGAQLWDYLSERMALSRQGLPENEARSMTLHISLNTRKKVAGKGPYPALVKTSREDLRQDSKRPVVERWALIKFKVALTLCKLFCFLRIRGVEGLERWLLHKFSVPYAWRRRALRRRARRFYRESLRRGRVFGEGARRNEDDGRRGGTPARGGAEIVYGKRAV